MSEQIDTSGDGAFADRLAGLERQLRRTRQLLIGAVAMGMIIPLIAWTSSEPQVLRVRALIVVDEKGTDRVILGAPIPDPSEGQRIAPATGLMINDSAGVERFGLGLFPNGRVVMGFDAPPGTGDPRNRERVSIVADQNGGAYIRLLDRATRAKAFLRLGEDDDAYLDLLDWTKDSIRTRRFGPRGDSTFTQKR